MIGCAMAHRANKIAYAMVRDQTSYDPAAGPDHSLAASSIAAHPVARRSGQPGAPAAQRGRTRLTVTSSDTQSGGEEASETRPQKGADLAFTTKPAGETLDGTKGRTTRRSDYGGHLGVTPLLAWRPALRHHGSPNDAR